MDSSQSTNRWFPKRPSSPRSFFQQASAAAPPKPMDIFDGSNVVTSVPSNQPTGFPIGHFQPSSVSSLPPLQEDSASIMTPNSNFLAQNSLQGNSSQNSFLPNSNFSARNTSAPNGNNVLGSMYQMMKSNPSGSSNVAPANPAFFPATMTATPNSSFTPHSFNLPFPDPKFSSVNHLSFQPNFVDTNAPSNFVQTENMNNPNFSGQPYPTSSLSTVSEASTSRETEKSGEISSRFDGGTTAGTAHASAGLSFSASEETSKKVQNGMREGERERLGEKRGIEGGGESGGEKRRVDREKEKEEVRKGGGEVHSSEEESESFTSERDGEGTECTDEGTGEYEGLDEGSGTHENDNFEGHNDGGVMFGGALPPGFGGMGSSFPPGPLPPGEGFGLMEKSSAMKYELLDVPPWGPRILYGLQHFASVLATIILIPLIAVPEMGGSKLDTSIVICHTLFLCGLSSLLHSLFGTRLPLLQSPSLAFLPPLLSLARAPHLLSILDDGERFKETMREVMGAGIVVAMCQVLVGWTGFMVLLNELINPLVVAPSLVALALSLFPFAFPLVGSCFEIGVPQIVVVVFFSLYLRKVTFRGNRLFQTYAFALGLVLVWFYAHLLTISGAYDFPNCSLSNVLDTLSTDCTSHVRTMLSCRTDASDVLAQSHWLRIPRPFLHGGPIFRWGSIFLMLPSFFIAVVDSVSSYHSTSLLVASSPPSALIVSRGIGTEGLCSLLASLFTLALPSCHTMTESIHTLAVTKCASRSVIVTGAIALMILSCFAKFCALLASIPQVIVGGMICVYLSHILSIGLGSLRYVEMGSSRNLLICGLSLLLGFSVPEYFSGFLSREGHSPIQTSNDTVNFVLSTLLSLPVFIAFVVAFFLDNTVGGSPSERGVFVWAPSSLHGGPPGGMMEMEGGQFLLREYAVPNLSRISLWKKD